MGRYNFSASNIYTKYVAIYIGREGLRENSAPLPKIFHPPSMTLHHFYQLHCTHVHVLIKLYTCVCVSPYILK
jgi:hypothetical protein